MSADIQPQPIAFHGIPILHGSHLPGYVEHQIFLGELINPRLVAKFDINDVVQDVILLNFNYPAVGVLASNGEWVYLNESSKGYTLSFKPDIPDSIVDPETEFFGQEEE